MAGKYTRIDNNRRPASSHCTTITSVVFVALCLVGLWMMTPTSTVPAKNVDVPDEKKVELKEPVRESNEGKQQQFEDNPGDLSDDSTKGDNNPQVGSKDYTQGNQEGQPEEKPVDKQEEKPNEIPEEKSIEKPDEKLDVKPEEKPNENPDEKPEENPEKKQVNSDVSNDSEDGSKSEPDGEQKKEDGDSKNEDLESGDKKANGDTEDGSNEKKLDLGENDQNEKKDDLEESPKKPEENPGETKNSYEQNGNNELEKKEDNQAKNKSSDEIFPSGAQSELLNETTTTSGAWSTQVAESKKEKEVQQSSTKNGYGWKFCNVTAGPDYIPCLDNLQAIKHLPTTMHYEHRERHCPAEASTCLVPLPEGYRRSIEWPTSREKIWYNNVPHTKLAEVKGHQNWVKVSGEYLTFPGGGTQFKYGALHYIDFLNESVPDIAWGKRSRVILDVGCGVASFGGYLFERDVLAMSFAPKDEHEAQVQFALERGIPGLSAVMGTQRLPFPGRVFDAVHCARCRVPWHIEGGKLLLELNRVLRPGGLFIWSATPVYQKLAEDVEIWEAMTILTKQMCWELVSINKDTIDKVSAAIYRKPTSNDCYNQRSQNEPPICPESDDPNAAWNVQLQACMHKVPVSPTERGSKWPEQWPIRLERPPYWLLPSQAGVYGRTALEDFTADYEHWKRVVTKSYLNGIGINWSSVRNVMDMRSVYGGFAAALKDLNVWVMNVVPIDSADTLPIIYERGLFGIYHDWCESFNTYPRSYDLLHADHLFSNIKKRCNLVAVVAEVDRILRPEGTLIVRDDVETLGELENMMRAMQWEVRMTYSKEREGLLCIQKSMWRPKELETITYAIE